MTGLVFVDTNVLVYREDNSDPAKQSRAQDWIALLVPRRAARISFQVLQELHAALVSKLGGISVGESRQIVRELAAWRPVSPDLAPVEHSWRLQERYRLSWWDALIVAAAHRCKCSALLTEDLQHDQLLDEIRVVNPFRSPERTPAEVLEALPR